MGERQSDGGRAGRRRVPSGHPERPEGVVSAPGRPVPVSVEGPAGDTARLEALLAAALVRDEVDAGAEQRAVAAFVAAREPGAHGARTRLRDDWRAPRRRFGGRSLRTTLGALVAGCALSGVAVAGIHAAGAPGGGRSPGDTGPDRTPSAGPVPKVSEIPEVPDASGSSPSSPSSPSSGSSGSSGVSGAPEASASAEPGRDGARGGAGRAEAAGDAEAWCRAYERVAGRGRAVDAPVWERLVAAAGGAERVDAYCAGRSAAAPPAPVRPGTPAASEAGAVPRGEAGGAAKGEGEGGRGGVGVPPGRQP
ncbi:hypothetical protein [Streptomyces sp. MA15]|uniref:hypothetical protein n=1 Tax=Streptomyces sp. MA15 TaxID=3055061 RepID=UPI0025AF224E|nr:hypothetical protein [Streptomyces sp. MA15]MDN3272091.1 hypothetical protein [Streptomyces sp. MA15]